MIQKCSDRLFKISKKLKLAEKVTLSCFIIMLCEMWWLLIIVGSSEAATEISKKQLFYRTPPGYCLWFLINV